VLGGELPYILNAMALLLGQLALLIRFLPKKRSQASDPRKGSMTVPLPKQPQI